LFLLYFSIGSRGRSIELISNYFPITTYTDWSLKCLNQYRVDFNPVQERIIQRGRVVFNEGQRGQLPPAAKFENIS